MTSTDAPTSEHADEIISDEVRVKRQKVELPEGMSKNAWKKLQKQKKWDEQKTEYREMKKNKRRVAKKKKAEKKLQGWVDPRKPIPSSQSPSGVRVIMDCEFDELMSDKEIVSLSTQISRSYAAKRRADYEVGLTISSFNKRLKERFDKSVSHYPQWKNIKFEENNSLSELLPKDQAELSKYVYLTADTENEIEDLQESHTYIIGGIVDKNRHKELCLKKAKDLGLQVARLPIGKYIQMNSRHVLATSHVYEIMCMWFEQNKDWEKAFNLVLPPRKLKKNDVSGTDGAGNDTGSDDNSEESDADVGADNPGSTSEDQQKTNDIGCD
ncbi:hypothetical protein JCM33374_g3462 [Metschnikowia sp. JCM 33374]|nr:hypothetical protein JCM33374_g3462 [Metschnikowia sp. JCM 33374]